MCDWNASDSILSAGWLKEIQTIGVAREGIPPTFSEHIVILCFKRLYPKQHIIICIKSSILDPQNVFGFSPNFGLANLLIQTSEKDRVKLFSLWSLVRSSL